jgi:hypothetical protein
MNELLNQETNLLPITADTSIEYLIEAYAKNRAEIDKLKILEDELKEQITQYMGNHTALVDSHGKRLAQWVFKKGASRFDREGFKRQYPNLEKQFTKQGEPTRAFSVLVRVV